MKTIITTRATDVCFNFVSFINNKRKKIVLEVFCSPTKHNKNVRVSVRISHL